MTNSLKQNIDKWLKNYNNSHRARAIENASRNFDNNDSINVNIIEAMMGRESSFGDSKYMGTRGSDLATISWTVFSNKKSKPCPAIKKTTIL